MIKINNICKSYNNKTVLKSVSVNLEKGKITSFIGPNGAGKSTLLSIITRLIKGDKGEVLVEGKAIDAWDKSELARKISILKQSNNVNIRLKVRELVSFGRFPYNEGILGSKDEEIIEKSLKYMNLSDIENMYLDELSGGQRQRAFIAMILAQETDYIFLDEPLNNLDMKSSVEIMRLLRNLCDQEGKTIILVMHDINFTAAYSDHIIAMKGGEIFKEGDVNSIIDEELLNKLYSIDFKISNIGGRNFCLYF